MQAHAWTSGQYRQVGPPSYAATHPTHDTVRNQQVRTADNSSLYWSSDTIQPAQSAHFNTYDEAYSNRQTNRQNSAVSFQLPTAGITNNYHMKMIHNNRQNSFANTQSRNPPLPVTSRCHVTPQQDFHQNSARNPSIQSPPNMVKTSATYAQQDASGRWNQQAAALGKQSNGMRNGNSSYLKNHSILTWLLQDENVESAKHAPTKTTTNTSPPHKQVGQARPLESVAVHNKELCTAHHHRQHNRQRGFSSSNHPPSYNTPISQSDNSITSNPASSKQTLHVASMNQTPQQFRSDHYLAKTNDLAAYNARLKEQEIEKIVVDLRNSFFPGTCDFLGGKTSSPYGGMQCDSRTQSQQNAQPMTLTASESSNSNASRLLNPTLPQPTLSPLTRAQQQASAPNVFHVTAAGDGGGNGKFNAAFPNSERVSEVRPACMKLCESLPQHQNKTESDIIEIPDILLSPLKASDGCLLSPGRSGSRAVAVVQPLSLESCRFASGHISSNVISLSTDNTATDESLKDLEKSFVSSAVSMNTPSYPENPEQPVSRKSVIRCSGASNGVTSDLSQKQCVDDTVPGLDTNVHIDQHAASTPEQSVTPEVPPSQSSDNEKGEDPADPKNSVFELSSLQTTQWTAEGLSKLILTCEKITKLKENIPEFDRAKLLQIFWDGDIEKCVETYRNGLLDTLVIHCQKIGKHLTDDSVILSQVKHSSRKQLSNYHVLQDNEVYSEVPYKSSWLNVDEQLDYIDKEFGFPWSLKRSLLKLGDNGQSDQARPDSSTPAQIDSDVPSQTECELAELTEVKQPSPAEAASTQTTSPENTESADSSDPHYSFEIQVLPPEEARLIYEQTLSNIPQSVDTDGQPESVVNGSVEHVDAMLSDSKEGAVSSLKQVCCIERWIEMLGSSVPSIGKCNCANEQSRSNYTDKTPDKEEMSAQKDEEVISSDCKFNSDVEAENQTDQKNVSSERTTVIQTIDLTDNDDEPPSCPDEGLMDNHMSSDRSHSSVVVISGDEDEDLNSSRNETPKWMPNAENDYKEAQMTDIEESRGQAQLTSTNVADPSQKNQSCAMAALQKTLSLDGKPEPVERKRESSGDRLFSLSKKAKKCPANVDSSAVLETPPNCGKVLSDATSNESFPSNDKTVKLVLFGAETPNKHSLTCVRRSHSYTPDSVSAVQNPPEALVVSLSPLKRRSSETTEKAECSVKELIYEKWRTSFPPAKIKQRDKLNKQKCSFASSSGASPKKAEKAGPPNTGELLFGSETRLWHQNNRLYLKRKRKASHSDGHKTPKEGKDDKKEGKKKKQRRTRWCLDEILKQLADKERSDRANGSHGAGPLQKNNVLKFSVLPSGFSFNSGSGGSNESKEAAPEKPSVIYRKENSLNKTVRPRGTWVPNEKKYPPILSPAVPPKTSSLFSKFQNKYKDKVRKSTNQ